MRVAVIKERREGERRVAMSPPMCERLCKRGLAVRIEKNAGIEANMPDEAFVQAGALLAETAAEAVEGADIILCVRAPLFRGEGQAGGIDGSDQACVIPKGAVLIGVLEPQAFPDRVGLFAELGLKGVFAVDLAPRISRAQSMDVLSSQANLTGYCAAVRAADIYGRVFPMMMTAAGTLAPAKVLVIGAGVAGLQAIATARRLGAVVSASDVRPATREQVESLGARFVGLSDLSVETETKGGYARELDMDAKSRHEKLLATAIEESDIVITTALVQGRAAPKLVSARMVASMQAGSVIIDLAGPQGGNCELTRQGQTVCEHGVTIVDGGGLIGQAASAASSLLARNLVLFLELLLEKEAPGFAIDWSDEIVAACCLVRDGKQVYPASGAPETK